MSITQNFQYGPMMNMNGDWLIPVENYDIPCNIRESSRMDWEVRGLTVRDGSKEFYTDGSKIGTETGAGIFGPGQAIPVAMENYPTMFQAEIFT